MQETALKLVDVTRVSDKRKAQPSPSTTQTELNRNATTVGCIVI